MPCKPEGLSSVTQNPYKNHVNPPETMFKKMLGMVAHACNPREEEVETRRFLGHTGLGHLRVAGQ